MLPELVADLGLPQQLGISATLILGAWYVYRAKTVATVVATIFTSAVGYALVLLLAAAGAVAAGWVDPNLSVITDHVGTAIQAILEAIGGRLS